MSKIAVIQSLYKNDKPEYLKLSLDSILNQTLHDFVLFLGIDGPIGKDLRAVVESIDDDRLRIVESKENKGLAAILNDLLDECKLGDFEYIARMDSDDIAILDRFEKQKTFLLKHTDVNVIGGAINEIDGEGHNRGKIIVYPETPNGCYKFFAKRNPHAHPAVMFRKSFFDKAGCKYRPEYRQNQDTMLWLDGMKAGTKHANLQEVVLRFRFTNSLFKKRRNGWAFAKKQLHDRKIINKTLGYGFGATVFGYMMFCMLVSPPCVKKIAYKVFR